MSITYENKSELFCAMDRDYLKSILPELIADRVLDYARRRYWYQLDRHVRHWAGGTIEPLEEQVRSCLYYSLLENWSDLQDQLRLLGFGITSPAVEGPSIFIHRLDGEPLEGSGEAASYSRQLCPNIPQSELDAVPRSKEYPPF